MGRQTNQTSAASNRDNSAFTGMTMVNDDAEPDDMVLIEAVDPVPCPHGNRSSAPVEMCFVNSHTNFPNQKPSVGPQLSPKLLCRFVESESVKSRLSPLPRKTTEPHPPKIQMRSTECALFVSHGPYGIVDLGASQTVIGEQQLHELMTHLPADVRSRVREVPCNTVFRFGNSSTVMCSRAMLVPLSKWYVKICVVSSKTPFLISNNVFRTLGAQIDTASDHVSFSKIDVRMPLSLSEKKLYLLDFCELVKLSNAKVSKGENPGKHDVMPIMSSIA
jgi:hypothetical protein